MTNNQSPRRAHNGQVVEQPVLSATDPGAAYSPVPKKRRGHRRATGGSAFTGTEPKLAGLSDASASDSPHKGEDARATWLKEQRPPHYGQ